MNEINDSHSHLLDGIDPDAPQRRPRSYRFPESANLVNDLQELRQMNEADVRHYCDTLPRSDYIKR